MLLNSRLIRLLVIVIFIAHLDPVIAREPKDLVLIQILQDGIDGVDGLDNPRVSEVSADGSRVVVASADDNSFAVFHVADDFKLSFSQVFKNAYSDVNGLLGAAGLTLFNRANKVLVTGFYDGSLSVFSRENDKYQYVETITDGVSYKKAFGDNDAIADLDRFGLLGAWDVIKSDDETQIFVASYVSNGITIFDVTAQQEVVFNRSVKSPAGLKNGLGKPVSLALSPSNNELYAVGFEGHQLTIFERDKTDKLVLKQVLKNGIDRVQHFLNPQKIVVSPDGNYLYVACSGSHSIVVFSRMKNGQYAFLQAVTNSELGGSGLTGAGSLAISPSGKLLYAAGESDVGLVLFDVAENGYLNLRRRFLGATIKTGGLEGVSSITIADNGRYLLLTEAKKDSLSVFKIRTLATH